MQYLYIESYIWSYILYNELSIELYIYIYRERERERAIHIELDIYRVGQSVSL